MTSRISSSSEIPGFLEYKSGHATEVKCQEQEWRPDEPAEGSELVMDLKSTGNVLWKLRMGKSRDGGEADSNRQHIIGEGDVSS